MKASPEAMSDRNKNFFVKLLDDNGKVFRDLVGWLIQPCLDFIRLQCKLFITTSPLHLVHVFLNLYTCTIDDCLSTVEGETVPHTQVR